MLSLYADGDPQPGALAIAHRAGVSERTVYRYFDDLESLAATAIEHQWARGGHLFAPPPNRGNRRTRISALVDQRLRIHDAFGPFARAAALLASSSPTVARIVALRRRVLREQTVAHLEREIDRRRGSRRGELVDALDAATSLEHVEYLRVSLGRSRRRARGVMIESVAALLALPSRTSSPPAAVR